MNGEKLARVINQGREEKETFYYGTVLSTDPISIRIDEKRVLDEDFLIVGMLCRKRTVDVGNSNVVLWRGLRVGDTVLLIRSNNSQKWYLQEIL